MSVHAKPVCAGYQIGDVIGGMNGQRMLSITWSRCDESGHIAGHLALLLWSLRQNSDHQIFKRDDPDTQMNQFSIGQITSCGHHVWGGLRECPTFIVPPRKRTPPDLGFGRRRW